MPDTVDVNPDRGGQVRPCGWDAGIAALAARQYGLVSRAQLREHGLRRRAVEHRVEQGRLHPLHRGIYAVGHRSVSREGRWMAAVLAGGHGAVLSHRAAAELWELRPPAGGAIEATVPRSLRSRPGLRFHRVALPDHERTTHRGIPVATPARILLDLATVLRRHELERAAEEAERRALVEPAALDALFAEHPRAKGIRVLRAIADSGRPQALTRSDLEARFLRFLDRADLPTPRVNARIRAGGRRLEVDFVWPRQRVAVELDGHAYHSTRAAFERDRERDRLLQAAGWRVVRITWRQLRDDPEAVARDLRRLLAPTVAVNPDIGG
ncbi:MAG TPA: type IV toxin-antitoxin system AbiEi family antitoxin domain-containing protein [Solirubrobacteraceae bacterium]|nr:type IV toxin-antitoxin system AbiEi family antitoxin domain-containing protein [Solirubrobacteraceae bacterium]